MPARRKPSAGEPHQTWALGLVAAFATFVLVAAGGEGGGREPLRTTASWQGLAGGARPRVALGQRMIVVLRAPSLADRVTRAGGRATDRQERKWRSAVLASQNVLISRLGVQGVRIQTEFRYTRVLNGFSAPLEARALTMLERAPEVAGVYPVRTAYPASVSSRALTESSFAPGARPDFRLPGYDGRGVTIALLDTGVDRAQPFLRGRVVNGVDIVGGQTYALAAPKPDDPGQLERHGTEMAGLLVGAGGPSGLAGVATGASILPIRVAGWQRDATGAWAIYARSDQVIAGLESAVDPNGDGDAHDAARIALIGVATPFAAFADDPVARAAGGALRLDTLVVVPAGNDGVAAGPAFGSISGPGGAPAALTVGAADTRGAIERVRVIARAGLQVVYDGVMPLGGAVAPEGPLTLGVAAPRRVQVTTDTRSGSAPTLDRFFTADGRSLVVGRAALVPAGDAPGLAAANAVRAGAAAVVVDQSRLPGGALGVDEEISVPVVGLPPEAARALLEADRDGESAAISIGAPSRVSNPAAGRVAAFSSSGLAFDGRVKPDVVAPGVGLTTAEPGLNEDGSPRFGTVNGSSAAAAVVAGAAALLAHARPSLRGEALKSMLVTSARPLPAASVESQGAGMVDLGRAAATELVVTPPTLALGEARGAGWRVRQRLTVTNVSGRAVRLLLEVDRDAEGAAAVVFRVRPRRVLLRPGARLRVRLDAIVASVPHGRAPAEGVVTVRIAGGATLRVPWAITFARRRLSLLGPLELSNRRFEPSDAAPSVLRFRAGRLLRSAGRYEVVPLERLDIELRDSEGDRLGLLARLRNVVPGVFTFGITGRGPAGQVLDPGKYRLRVIAVPTRGGPATRRSVGFQVD
jgi:Subtilase family